MSLPAAAPARWTLCPGYLGAIARAAVPLWSKDVSPSPSSVECCVTWPVDIWYKNKMNDGNCSRNFAIRAVT
jgi:hypothetical protein